MIRKAISQHNNKTTARIRRLHPPRRDKIGIRLSNSIEFISVEDIFCCEAWGNYCRIHIVNREEPILVSKTLKHVISVLPEGVFLRTHQSFVVRTDFILSIGNEVILNNGMHIPLSRRQKPELLSWVKLHITLI